MAEILPIRPKTLYNQSIDELNNPRYMAEILPIRRKTQYNQSINALNEEHQARYD